MPQSKGRPINEFTRFHALTKRVVSVPKTEIDKRASEHRRVKEKNTKKSS